MDIVYRTPTGFAAITISQKENRTLYRRAGMATSSEGPAEVWKIPVPQNRAKLPHLHRCASLGSGLGGHGMQVHAVEPRTDVP